MDGWLEPRTRIPFVGIIAMVLIVAVVAVFIKTQLQPLFPETEITVEDEQALTGRASSSFYGLREVDLERKELLRGSLSRNSEATVFTVDVPNQLLTIETDHKEEVVLRYDDGLLIANFEYDALPTSVAVDAAARTLAIGTERTMPTSVSLSDEVIYTGVFSLKGIEYSVTLLPSEQAVMIGNARVSLTNDGTWHGTWNNRPVTVDMENDLLSIEEVY